jgi:chemotaxis protein histidine kinase CheA
MAMASSDSSSGGNGDRDVFGSLPNTRPQRRSARRDRAGAKAKPAASGPAQADASAKAKPAAGARPAAGAKPAARAKAAAQAKPSARAKPAAGAKRDARAKPAAQAEPAARAKPAAQAQPAATAAPPRATTSKIPPAGYATPRGDDDGVPHGAELVTTAVQAAGELAQIGLAAGGRALKSALGRLPRP